MSAGRTPVLVSLTVAPMRGAALDEHDRDEDMMAALSGPRAGREPHLTRKDL